MILMYLHEEDKQNTTEMAAPCQPQGTKSVRCGVLPGIICVNLADISEQVGPASPHGSAREDSQCPLCSNYHKPLQRARKVSSSPAPGIPAVTPGIPAVTLCFLISEQKLTAAGTALIKACLKAVRTAGNHHF